MIRLTDVRKTMTSAARALCLQALKTEAKAWREHRKRLGEAVAHSAALEVVAQRHGFRDWNTACAVLPDLGAPPLAVNDRVQGLYLGHAFRGAVLEVRPLGAGLTNVTVRFDEPINVSASTRFSHVRRRVTAMLDEDGVSPAMTSDGQPHLRLTRA
jgi:hypothetical protein